VFIVSRHVQYDSFFFPFFFITAEFICLKNRVFDQKIGRWITYTSEFKHLLT